MVVCSVLLYFPAKSNLITKTFIVSYCYGYIEVSLPRIYMSKLFHEYKHNEILKYSLILNCTCTCHDHHVYVFNEHILGSRTWNTCVIGRRSFAIQQCRCIYNQDSRSTIQQLLFSHDTWVIMLYIILFLHGISNKLR